jgi:protein FAM32A
MPSEDYTSTPSTGKLKLKGVKDSKIAKKGKKNKSSGKGDVKPSAAGEKEDNSMILSKLEDEDREIDEEGRQRGNPEELIRDGDGEVEGGEGEDLGARHKTEAEKRYDEQRRRRVSLHAHLTLLMRV